MERHLSRSGWTLAASPRTRPAPSRPIRSCCRPSNVTGSLHMGHALERTMITRRGASECRAMRCSGSQRAPTPCRDRHQSVVEQQLAVDGKTKKTSAASCSWTRCGIGSESGGAIGGQMRRLGDGVDWSRDQFLDERSVAGRCARSSAAMTPG
ncbi:class I tRNA ligase family protein [Mycobacterium tuberculosis]